MLTFTLYTADDYDRSRRQVHIDAAAVISVEEAERRPAYGGYWQVAIVTLITGDKYIVEDDGRTVARRIIDTIELGHGASRMRPPATATAPRQTGGS